MNHSPSPPDEPSLFDLPLQGPLVEEATEGRSAVPAETPTEETARPARRGSRRASASETLPLFQASSAEPGAEPEPQFQLVALQPLPAAEPAEPAAWPRLAHGARLHHAAAPAPAVDLPEAALPARFKAASADLVVLAAVAALSLVGTLRLGVAVHWTDWPAFAAFLLAFSFLYSVISLAFWGQTPGMVWAGIVARSEDTEPLAFGQTARRWIGGLVTLALAGLPGLLALGGRSLADRISGSRTLPLDVPTA